VIPWTPEVIRVSPPLRCLLALAVALVALPAAAAPAEDVARARQHFAAGRTHYDLKEYEPALAEFKDAYRWVQDPVFLFNIAQCHWKLGREREAIDFYRNYLRRAPNATNRPEVERRVQELEAALARRPPASQPSPLPPPQPAPVPAAPAAPPPALVVEAPVSPPVDQVRPQLWRRWWFWAGVAVLAAGAGAVTLSVARRGQVGDCMGVLPCRDLGP
jgi:tetratricopeptide (TPR) repeat protein